MSNLRNGLMMKENFEKFDLSINVKKYFVNKFGGFGESPYHWTKNKSKFQKGSQDIGIVMLDNSYEANVLRRWFKVYQLQMSLGLILKNMEMCFPKNLEIDIFNVYGIFPVEIFNDNLLLFGYRRMCKIESELFFGKYNCYESGNNTKTISGFIKYIIEREISKDKNSNYIFKKITERLK